MSFKVVNSKIEGLHMNINVDRGNLSKISHTIETIFKKAQKRTRTYSKKSKRPISRGSNKSKGYDFISGDNRLPMHDTDHEKETLSVNTSYSSQKKKKHKYRSFSRDALFKPSMSVNEASDNSEYVHTPHGMPLSSKKPRLLKNDFGNFLFSSNLLTPQELNQSNRKVKLSKEKLNLTSTNTTFNIHKQRRNQFQGYFNSKSRIRGLSSSKDLRKKAKSTRNLMGSKKGKPRKNMIYHDRSHYDYFNTAKHHKFAKSKSRENKKKSVNRLRKQLVNRKKSDEGKFLKLSKELPKKHHKSREKLAHNRSIMSNASSFSKVTRNRKSSVKGRVGMRYTPSSSSGKLNKLKRFRSNLSGEMMSSLIDTNNAVVKKSLSRLEKFEVKKPTMTGSLIEKLAGGAKLERLAQGKVKDEENEFKEKYVTVQNENEELKVKLVKTETELDKSQKLVEVRENMLKSAFRCIKKFC